MEHLAGSIYMIKENWLYYIVEILSNWYKDNKTLIVKYKQWKKRKVKEEN
jgi:hypothetical protein